MKDVQSQKDIELCLELLRAAESDEERTAIAYSYAPFLDSKCWKAVRAASGHCPGAFGLLRKMRAAHVLEKIIAADSADEMMQICRSHASEYDKEFRNAVEELSHEARARNEVEKAQLLEMFIPMLEREHTESKSDSTSFELYNEGVRAAQAGRHEEAIALLTKAIDATPDHPLPWYARGSSRAAQKEYERALADFEKSLDLKEGDFPEAWHQKAACLLALHRPQEALEACEQAVSKLATMPEAHVVMGKCCMVLNRPAEGVGAFRRALDLNPASADAWYLCGSAYLDAGQPKDARSCFLRAVSLRDDFPEAERGLYQSERELKTSLPATALVEDRPDRRQPDWPEGAPIQEAVEQLLWEFGISDSGEKGTPISSAFVIGSFTSREERTAYSDIDIAVLFREGYLALQRNFL